MIRDVSERSHCTFLQQLQRPQHGYIRCGSEQCIFDMLGMVWVAVLLRGFCLTVVLKFWIVVNVMSLGLCLLTTGTAAAALAGCGGTGKTLF